MATNGFQIYISGGTISLDDWQHALETPETQLPPLDEAQKEAARKIGMSEPDYARGILADQIGLDRQRERGKRLGEIIELMLDDRGGGSKLESLARRGVDFYWIAVISQGGWHLTEVKIPLDLADDVLDSGNLGRRSQLERLLLQSLDSAGTRAVS